MSGLEDRGKDKIVGSCVDAQSRSASDSISTEQVRVIRGCRKLFVFHLAPFALQI